MANPYFNAVYYLQQNPDVFAAGYTVDTAWNHYAQFGANEGYANGGTVRAPNPWFDVKYYLNNNPDLIAAGITPAMALDHFTTYGMTAAEDRAPNGTVAGNPITEASLLAYAMANADLRSAFGIADNATTLTAAQQNSLISHFYQYGYSEDRADPPTTVVVPNPNQGETYSLTINQDTLTGTSGNDTFNAGIQLASDGTTEIDTVQSFDTINGGAGTDTLSATVNSGAATVTPTLTNVENVTIRSTKDSSGLNLSGSTGVTTVGVANSTGTANVTGVGAIASFSIADQKKNVAFNDGTATTVALSAKNVGTVSATAAVEVDVNFDDNAFTTANLTVENSNIELLSTTAGDNDLTTVSVAATGSNTVKLTSGAATITAVTVTGAGSVDLSGAALTAVKTLTVADGGATVDATGGVLETATTGAGNDTITVVGTNIKNVSTGAGNDKVNTVTSALAATSVVDLGAGDDTLTLSAAPTAGATLAGGDGTDTLAVAYAAYTTISGYGATDLAKITGFETLSVTGAALANADVVNLSKVTGLTSAQILGVANTGAASITNVGANSTVIIKGDMQTGADDGSLTISLKDATGAADVLNLTIDQAITQNNDGTVDTYTSAITGITTTGIETLNVTSTGTLSAAVTAGAKTDVAVNGLNITNDNLVNLNVLGDQAFTFTSAAGMTKLATIDMSGNTAGGTVSVANAATDGTAAAITITGSGAADTITGSGNADTISGGAGNDTITGGAKADALSGGAGNDTFEYTAGSDSTLAQLDVISDFSANTYGNGTNGAAGTGAAADSTKWTGDVLKLNVDTVTYTKVDVSVQTSSADAQVFIQNVANATADTIAAALDSTSGKLYIDFSGDGTVDSVIQLTGVTAITEAAFVLY